MILQKNTANRLGIFVFYDKDGIADEYNFYFIEELKKQVSRLLVICNGDVEEEAGKRFSRIADEVMMRGNEGFDITAYHLGLKNMATTGTENLTRSLSVIPPCSVRYIRSGKCSRKWQ